MAKWQVGQSVKYKGSRWIVLERVERPESVILTLGPES